MTIEIPEKLEQVLKSQAQAIGVSPEQYVYDMIERGGDGGQKEEALPPFKTGYGMWKKYGVSLSAEDIDENRRDMFKNFGESFE